MDKSSNNSWLVILLISACLLLPFLESMHGGVLWGLNWHSPRLMDTLSHNLLYIKLVLVITGFILLFVKPEKIKSIIKNKIARWLFFIIFTLVAVVQIPLLCLGIMLNGTSLSRLDYIHKQSTFDDRTIYIYTADPGAMGKAYHYAYLNCPLAFGRYELKQIAKFSWMHQYTFYIEKNNLVVIDKNPSGLTHTFDMSNITCAS
ncbi:hypothetical protein [Pseudoalteromonas sp.]|uniref:hypothetical protein n=1 Tax=Pseudoalteromonas sp. TaxID=53249 RepID=UPI001BCC28AA|nr:hypothetical protein [Pseudoalteromonas sp.]